VPIMLLMQSTAANMEAIQAQLDTTNQVVNQKIAQKQELNKAVTDLKKQSAAAKLVYDDLALSLNALKTGQETINGNLSLVLSVLPPNVELKGVQESMDRLTITGQSNNEAEVLRYARDLDASGRFAEVTISSLAINLPDKGSVEKTGNISFTLTLDCKE
jgi:Tfp pilus assembly protein PilN